MNNQPDEMINRGFRYFEGVQGDIKRRGELFGSENLFKLHEDTLATKMAVSFFQA